MSKSMIKVMLNNTLTRIDINRIDIYSAKNNIKKGTDLYSVLKPLTNSDSPSEKSKGLRFVSANALKMRSAIKVNIKTLKGVSFT